MDRGYAQRQPAANADELAEVILKIKPYEAITTGRLRPDLPDKVKVTTKVQFNGAAGTICRDRDHLTFIEGHPAWALIDYDSKAKPASIVVEDYWALLIKLFPWLRNAERVTRSSTSAGLYNAESGEDVGSGGLHIFLLVKDGSDIPRLLQTMHERAWLAGYGWLLITANGRMLPRSIGLRSGQARALFI